MRLVHYLTLLTLLVFLISCLPGKEEKNSPPPINPDGFWVNAENIKCSEEHHCYGTKRDEEGKGFTIYSTDGANWKYMEQTTYKSQIKKNELFANKGYSNYGNVSSDSAVAKVELIENTYLKFTYYSQVENIRYERRISDDKVQMVGISDSISGKWAYTGYNNCDNLSTDFTYLNQYEGFEVLIETRKFYLITSNDGINWERRLDTENSLSYADGHLLTLGNDGSWSSFSYSINNNCMYKNDGLGNKYYKKIN